MGRKEGYGGGKRSRGLRIKCVRRKAAFNFIEVIFRAGFRVQLEQFINEIIITTGGWLDLGNASAGLAEAGEGVDGL